MNIALPVGSAARACLAALGIFGLPLLACNDLPTFFEPLPAVRLAITGGNCRSGTSLRVIQGRSCEVEATAWDDNSREVLVAFQWSTANPAVATVSPKPGFDTIVAQVTGVSVDTTSLTVSVGGQPELMVVDTLSVVPSNNPNF